MRALTERQIEQIETLIREWRRDAGPKWGMMSEEDEAVNRTLLDCADSLETILLQSGE